MEIKKPKSLAADVVNKMSNLEVLSLFFCQVFRGRGALQGQGGVILLSGTEVPIVIDMSGDTQGTLLVTFVNHEGGNDETWFTDEDIQALRSLLKGEEVDMMFIVPAFLRCKDVVSRADRRVQVVNALRRGAEIICEELSTDLCPNPCSP